MLKHQHFSRGDYTLAKEFRHILCDATKSQVSHQMLQLEFVVSFVQDILNLYPLEQIHKTLTIKVITLRIDR